MLDFDYNQQLSNYKEKLNQINIKLSQFIKDKPQNFTLNYVNELFNSNDLISFPEITTIELIKTKEKVNKLQEDYLKLNTQILQYQIKEKLNYEILEKNQTFEAKISKLTKENEDLRANLRKMFFKLKKTQCELSDATQPINLNSRLTGIVTPLDSYKQEMSALVSNNNTFLNDSSNVNFNNSLNASNLMNTTNGFNSSAKLNNNANLTGFGKHKKHIGKTFKQYKKLLEEDFDNIKQEKEKINTTLTQKKEKSKKKTPNVTDKDETVLPSQLTSYQRRSILMQDNFFKTRKSELNTNDLLQFQNNLLNQIDENDVNDVNAENNKFVTPNKNKIVNNLNSNSKPTNSIFKKAMLYASNMQNTSNNLINKKLNMSKRVSTVPNAISNDNNFNSNEKKRVSTLKTNRQSFNNIKAATPKQSIVSHNKFTLDNNILNNKNKKASIINNNTITYTNNSRLSTSNNNYLSNSKKPIVDLKNLSSQRTKTVNRLKGINSNINNTINYSLNNTKNNNNKKLTIITDNISEEHHSNNNIKNEIIEGKENFGSQKNISLNTDRFNTIPENEVNNTNTNRTNNNITKNEEERRNKKLGKTVKDYINGYKHKISSSTTVNNQSENENKIVKKKTFTSNTHRGSIDNNSTNVNENEVEGLQVILPEELSEKDKAIKLLRSINQIQKRKSINSNNTNTESPIKNSNN